MKHAHLILVFVTTLIIGACGGGGGGGGAGAPASGGTTPTLSFTGIAAVGYPIVGGTVQVKCAAGSLPSATTDSTGAWSTAGQATPPCAAQVSGGTINGAANTTPYHSIAMGTSTMNITPLTDLMAANMTGTATPNVWFAGLTGGTLATITVPSMATAQQNIITAFSGLPNAYAFQHNTLVATPGNTGDDTLAALRAAMSTTGVSHADLLAGAATPSFSSAAVTTLNAALPAAWATTVSGSKATITGMSPTSGKAGTTVTITGANFINARFPNPVISINGQGGFSSYGMVTPVSISAAEIVLRIPDRYISEATHSFCIKQDTSVLQVCTGNFNVNSSVPTITSFTPASGAPGTVVTITGTNLSAYNAVKIGDTPAVVTGASDTSLTVTVPRGTVSGAISVTTSYGSATSSGSFTVVYQPVLMGGTIQGSPLAKLSAVTDMTYLITYTLPGSSLVQNANPSEATCPSYTYGATYYGANPSASGSGIPKGITTDGANLYVTNGQIITKINIAAGWVCTLAGSGSAGNVDGIGAAARFYYPTAITTDGTNLYVVDSGNRNIRKIVIATGAVSTLNGSSNIFGVLTGTSYQAHITTDGVNLYITDTISHTIRKFVIATGEVSTLAGSGAADAVDGIGTAASFNWPLSITTDGINLYVLDYEISKIYANSLVPRIRKIVIATGEVSTLAFTSGTDLTTDGFYLYITKNSGEVSRINIWTLAEERLASSTVYGIKNGVELNASLYHPGAITTDGKRLYVLDEGGYYNGFVRKIAPAATVTGITRNAGVAGTEITISGTNFKSGSDIPLGNTTNRQYFDNTWPVFGVLFNGSPATITNSTDTSITAKVPNGATTGKVTVTTVEGGVVTLADIFAVGAPTITSMSSSTGIAGTEVTITGTNFDIVPGNNTAMFNGTPAFVTAATATSLTTTVPVGATTGTVSVTTGGGTATATSANSFSVGAPTVTGMNRSTGIAGTTVTITGANFDITPANNTVNIGGVQSTITTATATSLTTTVPVGATTGTVSVTTAGGAATAPGSFTVGAPTVSGISPSTGAAGTVVTISGTGFDVTPANNTVVIGGVSSTVTASTATSISTTVPSGASSGTVSVTTAGGKGTSASSFTVPIFLTGTWCTNTANDQNCWVFDNNTGSSAGSFYQQSINAYAGTLTNTMTWSTNGSSLTYRFTRSTLTNSSYNYDNVVNVGPYTYPYTLSATTFTFQGIVFVKK